MYSLLKVTRYEINIDNNNFGGDVLRNCHEVKRIVVKPLVGRARAAVWIDSKKTFTHVGDYCVNYRNCKTYEYEHLLTSQLHRHGEYVYVAQ